MTDENNISDDVLCRDALLNNHGPMWGVNLKRCMDEILRRRGQAMTKTQAFDYMESIRGRLDSMKKISLELDDAPERFRQEFVYIIVWAFAGAQAIDDMMGEPGKTGDLCLMEGIRCEEDRSVLDAD